MGINLDIPPHKLKAGHGPEVCTILSSLCDITLQKQKKMCAPWPPPISPRLVPPLCPRALTFARGLCSLKKPVHHPDAYAEEVSLLAPPLPFIWKTLVFIERCAGEWCSLALYPAPRRRRRGSRLPTMLPTRWCAAARALLDFARGTLPADVVPWQTAR